MDLTFAPHLAAGTSANANPNLQKLIFAGRPVILTFAKCPRDEVVRMSESDHWAIFARCMVSKGLMNGIRSFPVQSRDAGASWFETPRKRRGSSPWGLNSRPKNHFIPRRREHQSRPSVGEAVANGAEIGKRRLEGWAEMQAAPGKPGYCASACPISRHVG